jgi:predicted RNase H-like HicB family nuclease
MDMPVLETDRASSDAPNDGYAPSPVPKPVVAFFAVCRKIFGRAEDTRETIRNPPTIRERGTWDMEVLVEADAIDGGFVAETPDIPGAMAQGETEEEAVENLVDAIHGIVAAKVEEHYRELDLDMPSGVARRFSVHL